MNIFKSLLARFQKQPVKTVSMAGGSAFFNSHLHAGQDVVIPIVKQDSPTKIETLSSARSKSLIPKLSLWEKKEVQRKLSSFEGLKLTPEFYGNESENLILLKKINQLNPDNKGFFEADLILIMKELNSKVDCKEFLEKYPMFIEQYDVSKLFAIAKNNNFKNIIRSLASIKGMAISDALCEAGLDDELFFYVQWHAVKTSNREKGLKYLNTHPNLSKFLADNFLLVREQSLFFFRTAIQSNCQKVALAFLTMLDWQVLPKDLLISAVKYLNTVDNSALNKFLDENPGFITQHGEHFLTNVDARTFNPDLYHALQLKLDIDLVEIEDHLGSFQIK